MNIYTVPLNDSVLLNNYSSKIPGNWNK